MLFHPIAIYGRYGQPQVALDRVGYFVEACRGRSILHVGCSDWPVTEERIANGTLLHAHLAEVAQSLTGIDLSPEGAAALNAHGLGDVRVMNAEHMELSERFDVILAGDVLEHMSNPGLFIERASAHLKPDGELIIGVPSAYSLNALKVWLGRGEPVHYEHTAYYSPKTLAQLCSRYGLKPTHLVWTAQAAMPGDSKLYIGLRNSIIRTLPATAPSLVMHFAKQVDDTYYMWK